MKYIRGVFLCSVGNALYNLQLNMNMNHDNFGSFSSKFWGVYQK